MFKMMTNADFSRRKGTLNAECRNLDMAGDVQPDTLLCLHDTHVDPNPNLSKQTILARPQRRPSGNANVQHDQGSVSVNL